MYRPIAKLVNTAQQTLGANENILFILDAFNSSSIGYNPNGTIELKTPGIYKILANFTVAPTSTEAEVALYESNMQSPGAVATETVVAENSANLAFNTVLTVKPGVQGTYATLAFKNIYAGQVLNANVIIEKI